MYKILTFLALIIYYFVWKLYRNASNTQRTTREFRGKIVCQHKHKRDNINSIYIELTTYFCFPAILESFVRHKLNYPTGWIRLRRSDITSFTAYPIYLDGNLNEQCYSLLSRIFRLPCSLYCVVCACMHVLDTFPCRGKCNL